MSNKTDGESFGWAAEQLINVYSSHAGLPVGTWKSVSTMEMDIHLFDDFICGGAKDRRRKLKGEASEIILFFETGSAFAIGEALFVMKTQHAWLPVNGKSRLNEIVGREMTAAASGWPCYIQRRLFERMLAYLVRVPENFMPWDHLWAYQFYLLGMLHALTDASRDEGLTELLNAFERVTDVLIANWATLEALAAAFAEGRHNPQTVWGIAGHLRGLRSFTPKSHRWPHS